MKKKTKNSISMEDIATYKRGCKICRIICYIILIIFIIFIIYGINYGFRGESPQFKITKTECRNESEVIGQELIDEWTMTCNMTITHFDIYNREIGKFCYDDFWAKENPCNASLCKFSGYQGGITAIVQKEEFSETYLQWRDIVETHEVCEEIEYDEMKIYESAIWRTYGKISKWCAEKPENITQSDWDVADQCSCNISGYSFKGNESYVRNKLNEIQNGSCDVFTRPPHIIKEEINTTISEKDLTISWLNIYCENEEATEKYLKYKCGDYLVEVIR